MVVLFSTLTGLYKWISVRLGRSKITDSNSMKSSLIYMYYVHSIFGKNCAYNVQIFTVDISGQNVVP